MGHGRDPIELGRLLQQGSEEVSGVFRHPFSLPTCSIAFNVAVYGVLRHTRGRLSLNYTLDNGVTETKNYFDSTQAANATKWSFQKLYEHTFPRDQHFKNHKLEVTLAACTDDQVCRTLPTFFPLSGILISFVILLDILSRLYYIPSV
jgi:hypothetical protein